MYFLHRQIYATLRGGLPPRRYTQPSIYTILSHSLSLFPTPPPFTAPHRTRLSITQTVYSLSEVLSSLGFASLGDPYQMGGQYLMVTTLV